MWITMENKPNVDQHVKIRLILTYQAAFFNF